MSRTRRVAATIVAVVATVLIGACGGDPSGGGERPVTDQEASRLAETLFANLEGETASFDLNGRLPDASTITMRGAVNWAAQVGRATVSASDRPDAGVAEVAWTRDVVVERIPELTTLTADLAQGGGEWFARGPDRATRQLDSLIQLVMGLASPQRDNAALIAQEEGTAWLRTDRVPDTEIDVDVMRFGPRTVFWLERDGFVLHRFEGNNQDGSRPVVVDLADHGAAEVELPPGDDVVDAALFAELYQAVTGEIPG